ncbi:hypothetical protein HPB50_008217 [Hyalomma asiaticum]|uniref:Uncharacterized protein n=1 Tax=Hyalomma asiaticum TaxID=266040 RepID=A0ACB7TKL9_HYAAI|nr:hypothetical protein HPB50_008217 [Hyalomma asiaticum]
MVIRTAEHRQSHCIEQFQCQGDTKSPQCLKEDQTAGCREATKPVDSSERTRPSDLVDSPESGLLQALQRPTGCGHMFKN